MKIAILGYGLEGESSFKYWSQDSSNEITIFDQKTPDRAIPAGIPTVFGEKYLDNLNGYDLLIRTSGLDKNKIKTDGKVWSATNEVFSKCPAEIIGVTGTKGKGTTASLIASIFESAGRKVWLTGNIGDVLLKDLKDIKPTDIVVYELSSFQLWDIERSPHVAVVTIIEPEHLNVHVDFADYVNAKANIRRFQKSDDICFYHPSNESSKYIAQCTNQGKAIRYGIADDGGVYDKDGYFCQDEHKICSLDSLQLVGHHNIENACAAISVAKSYDLTDENIENGLKKFVGLPHRIEFVKELNGVKYYNDSFSASTPAVVAAMKSFSGPEILIIGGVDRGGDFNNIADNIANNGNVKAVVIIGEIRHKLADIVNSKNPKAIIKVTDLKTMPEIVSLANSFTEPGDTVILSPGCGSFDMFKDFYDRGNQFKEVVNNL